MSDELRLVLIYTTEEERACLSDVLDLALDRDAVAAEQLRLSVEG